MKTQIFTVWTMLVMSTVTVFSQLPSSALNYSGGEATYDLPASSIEMVEKRGLYQRAYKTDDGRVIYQFSEAPLNYQGKNGEWLPVDITPLGTLNGGHRAANQNNPVGITSDGRVEIENASGKIFSVQTTEFFGEKVKPEEYGFMWAVGDGQQDPNQVFFGLKDNQVMQRSTFRHNGIKTDYLIHSPMAVADGTIKQQLNCNSDLQLSKHPMMLGALSIKDAHGEEMGILYPIISTDENGSISKGEYSFKKNQDGYEIILHLDKEWINSPQRTYPIVVDPLIVGPTTLWGGSYIPSCFVPAYAVDSILVTIPGQTTITGVFISGSYYADPFAGAIMAQGQMYFSSHACGQTQNLTVPPPTGNTAGTAYLTNGDYRNPITCCLGPSCTDRTFYLRMHLGRTAGGAGCNTNYIYHDPFNLYPFSCYVEGRTIESAGVQWTVTPTTVCSDECNLSFKPFVRYGVPPYTINHPWAAGPVPLGNPIYTCALTSFNVDVPITRPNCPIFCDTATSVNIPLPTITDACGNAVTGLPAKTVTIKPTPDISVSTDSILICSGDAAQFNFTVCPAGTTVTWTTPGFSGSGSIDTSFINPGPGMSQNTYVANANLNGCIASSDSMSFYTSPNPLAGSSHPLVAFIDQPVTFSDTTNYQAGSGGAWSWTFGDGGLSPDSVAIHSYSAPGTYNVCLIVNSAFGCSDTICDTIQVIPNELILPNVISTNNDGVNDILYFQYLPFYGISTLAVFNRWGEIVYESSDYQNNWGPTNLTDGTYFYIVTIPGHDPYTSTLNVFNEP